MTDPREPASLTGPVVPPNWHIRQGGFRIRLNSRATRTLIGVAVAAGIGFFLAVQFLDRNVRSDVLNGARAAVKSGQVDLAIRNLERFLNAHPTDLPTLAELAKVRSGSVRSIEEASVAAAVNDRLIRLDPDGAGRQDTRRKLVELYVRCGDWHRASAAYRISPESAAYELRYRAAEAIARDLVARADSRPGDHQLLASALEGLAVPGDPNALRGAVEEYQRALAGDPKDLVSAERLSLLCLDRLNDPGRGEKILDQLLVALPESPAARLVRYRYFLRLRRNDLAAVELEAATRLAGADVEVRLTAASDAIRRGDGPAARRHLEAIPDDLQDNLRVRVIRGMVDYNEERPDDAIDGWRQGLLSIGGTDADLTWWMAHAQLQIGRVAEARPLVAQYRRLAGDESQPLYRFLQAELDEKSGRPARAIPALEWARDRINEFWQAMVHMALGRCYEAVWDRSRALAAYRRANQIDPRLAEPRIAASRLLADRPDEATLEIERGLAQIPDDPALRIALAGTRLRQQLAHKRADRNWGPFDRALASAREMAPSNSMLVLLQAERMAQEGDLPGAIVLLERGAAASPKNASLWIAWSDALCKLGRLGEGLEVLRRGARPEASGDHAAIRIGQARVLNTMGRGREAVEVLARDQDALTPSDRSLLWESIGRIRASKGDESGARDAYGEWARILPDDPRPRLALIELAEDSGDAAVVRATVETLRQIGGTEDIAWRLCRAQELLWARTESDQPLSRRDPRIEEARRLIESVLVNAPEIPAAHLLRGQALERLNKPDEAIASYRRAWDRGASAALAKLVDLLTRLRKFDELAALKAKGQPARIDLLSAMGAYRAGDLEAASRFVEQIGQDSAALPATQSWQAQMLEALGRRDRSEALLKAVVDQKPDSLQAWLELIRSQAGHGKPGEARATIERARKALKGDRSLYHEACFAWANYDNPAAERSFQAAAEERPGDVDILVSAARFYEEAGRTREAIGQLRAARKAAPKDRGILRQEANLMSLDPTTWAEAVALIGPDDVPSDQAADRLARGMILARSLDPGSRTRALLVLESLLNDLPADAPEVGPARQALARLLLDSGQPDRARQVLMISGSTTADSDLLGLYVEALLRSRSLIEALRQIDRLEVLKPGDPATAAFRVRWIRESSRPDDFARALDLAVRERAGGPDAEVFGRAAFEAILPADPKALDQAESIAKSVVGAHPSASWMLGKIFFRRNRPGEALEACRASIESESADDRRGAAEVATDVATDPNVDEAYASRTEAILETALRRDPKNFAILTMVAMVRHSQARFEDEVRLYREALAVRAGDALASNNLAWALSEGLNRPEEALALLDQMILRKGRLGWVLDTRGVILTRLGRFDEAIRDLKEAAGDRPPPVTLYHLARVCMKAKRDQEFRHYRDLTRRSGVAPRDLDASERGELASILAL